MRSLLIGAVAGDIIGSIYEFNPTKHYNFDLFDSRMSYTDDSIMTIAVADWILHSRPLRNDALAFIMRSYGKRFPAPMGGYGGGFNRWLLSEITTPYNSYGNGSSMRVSPCGYAFSSLEKTLFAAKSSSTITHNHPEGVKGAQAVASAIYLARTGKDKGEIKDYIENSFNYDLNQGYDSIRPGYKFDSSCQGSVPFSIISFLESKNYEDAVRLAISLGGDADTMGAITGSIAAAYYKEIPDEIYSFAMENLPECLRIIVEEFDSVFSQEDNLL